MRRALLAFVMTVGMATAALAADVTGKWVGSVDTPNGPIRADLRVQGRGRDADRQRDERDGLACRSATARSPATCLTFDVDLEGGKITHEAKVNAAGDEIAIKATGDWGGASTW